jgi:hypothetical protein
MDSLLTHMVRCKNIDDNSRRMRAITIVYKLIEIWINNNNNDTEPPKMTLKTGHNKGF